MGEDVKLDVIRHTQESLSKYIKKPALTEKLLRKPPFRYLHDITTAVMRETGFLHGLYSQNELNPENVKDREAKIAFLEKLITAVNLSTGSTITARPSKIVAGLDVAKTNELLQTIANALEKKIDSSQAVEQILNKKTKGNSQQTPTKQERSKSNKVAENKTREQQPSESLKKKPKESKVKDAKKTESKKEKKTAKDVIIDKGPTEPLDAGNEIVLVDKTNNADTKDISAEKPIVQIEDAPVKPLSPPPPQQPHPSPNRHGDVTKTLQNLPEAEPEFRNNEAVPTNQEEELKRPPSARANHRKKAVAKKVSPEVENDVKLPTELVIPPITVEKKAANQSETKDNKRPRSAARPPSARPGAPRVRDRGTVLLAQADNKEINEPVNVIVDNGEVSKDDDETLVAVEAPTSLIDTAEDKVRSEVPILAADQAGHLVTQILDTQKELEDSTMITDTSSKRDTRWDRVGRESMHKEVEKLQAAIQGLTRAANPLGKLIDFLQEDVDSMQSELQTWMTTNSVLAKQLHMEEGLTEQSIEPLTRQLEEVNQLIEEQLEETSIVKAAIIRNDERLTRLMLSNSTHPYKLS